MSVCTDELSLSNCVTVEMLVVATVEVPDKTFDAPLPTSPGSSPS